MKRNKIHIHESSLPAPASKIFIFVHSTESFKLNVSGSSVVEIVCLVKSNAMAVVRALVG
ncbi:hypothetical protein Tsubulata_042705 [Turnera subulata]|uniref:Uncharacterized protein n=1 Tax=Turnera subulata TaxID=218843 RepID=A0A9Q0JRN0_9ROSI|nr:hypothetical protein Tsubulata_042705 [Turnera subulata]